MRFFRENLSGEGYPGLINGISMKLGPGIGEGLERSELGELYQGRQIIFFDNAPEWLKEKLIDPGNTIFEGRELQNLVGAEAVVLSGGNRNRTTVPFLKLGKEDGDIVGIFDVLRQHGSGFGVWPRPTAYIKEDDTVKGIILDYPKVGHSLEDAMQIIGALKMDDRQKCNATIRLILKIVRLTEHLDRLKICNKGDRWKDDDFMVAISRKYEEGFDVPGMNFQLWLKKPLELRWKSE